MTKPEFSHKAIYGTTKMGKSWLMKRIIKQLLKHKQKVIVYTGGGDFDFPKGCKFTTDEDVLEKWLQMPENYRSHVFIDEGDVLYEETTKKTHPNIWRLFKMGRHKGYTAYIATQFPTLIPPRVRRLCSECYCFRVGDEDSAKLVYKDYNSMKLNGVPAWKAILSLDVCNGIKFVMPDKIERFKLK